MIPRYGFSLLELLAVLVIFSLMGSVIAVASMQMRSSKTFSSVAESVEHLDRMMRWQARETGQTILLKYDEDQGLFRLFDGLHGFESEQNLIDQVAMPPGVHLESQWINTPDIEHDSFREFEVRCDAHGRSPTYALEFGDDENGQLFLLVAGLTGQIFNMENRHDIETIFDALPRLHAD